MHVQRAGVPRGPLFLAARLGENPPPTPMPGMSMRRLLREPLLHFLALGALLFALYGWINRGNASDDEIVVSRALIDSLRTQFGRAWQREPTPAELQGLIDGWVRDEALYREGRAMGLDDDDPVIRRRVAQKIEFLADGLTPAAPTEQELRAWLDEHADAYRHEARYSFRQLYFDPSRHGARLEGDVLSAQRALAAGKAIAGDATLFPPDMDDATASEVTRTFGTEFSAALGKLPVGEWSDPLPSGFGIHLVRLSAREEGRAATLDEVRAAVERDLLHERTEQGRKRFYAALLSKYEIRIENPEPDPNAAAAGGGAPSSGR
jgi:hypothetical protein